MYVGNPFKTAWKSLFCGRAEYFNTLLAAKSRLSVSGTDVMILKIFSPKKIAKKLAFFDSKQS
jgi:hypothetical protein